MHDVADRISNRIQLTTDGHRPYFRAVEDAFGGDIDYAVLHKIYGKDRSGPARYSPPECVGTRREGRVGSPDPKHISTSYVERQNLTLRMGNRRFTRLTNAHSKKWINHEHAISLFYFHYNFCRKHESLKGQTPAQAAGLTENRYTMADLVEMLEQEEQKIAKGGRINRDDRS